MIVQRYRKVRRHIWERGQTTKTILNHMKAIKSMLQTSGTRGNRGQYWGVDYLY